MSNLLKTACTFAFNMRNQLVEAYKSGEIGEKDFFASLCLFQDVAWTRSVAKPEFF